jgi:D-alanyl-lipoteichoic acid acyltransferase DltB (MBOAT superfamily)
VRYVYVPLGGSRVGSLRKIFNVFVVFTFVALWHDRTMKLLTWGWVLVLFIAVEMGGQQLVQLKVCGQI